MNKYIKYSIRIFLTTVFLSNLLFSSSTLILGNNIKDYDKIFEKIGETRVGIKPREIDKIRNPFVVIYKQSADSNKTKKPKIVYRLNAIFNNRAMINKKWYKRYSKIGTYKLIKIKKNSVLLRRANRSKELFIRKENESKIKFSSK